MSALQFYRTQSEGALSWVRGVEVMIARCGPRLMLSGGGPLEKETPQNNKRNRTATITPAQHAKICALFEAGVEMHAIARRVGRSYNAVIRHTRELRQRKASQ